MKHLIIISLVLLYYSVTIAQDVKNVDIDRNYTYFGLGYGTANINHKGLDWVINRYNSTRQGQPGAATLTKEMDNFSLISGVHFTIGHMNNKFENGIFWEYTMGYYRAQHKAEGINASGQLASRYLRLNNFYMLPAGGYMPFQTELLDVGFGMSCDVYLIYILTSLTAADPLDLTTVEEFPGVGFSFFPQINVFPISKSFPFAIMIRPYYYLDLLPSNVFDLNEKINPATADFDTEYDKCNGNLSHLGARISLNLSIPSRKQKATQNIKNTPEQKKKKTTSGFSQ